MCTRKFHSSLTPFPPLSLPLFLPLFFLCPSLSHPETQPLTLTKVHCQSNLPSLRKPSPQQLTLFPNKLPRTGEKEGERSADQRGLRVHLLLDGSGWKGRGQPLAADAGSGGGLGVLLAHSQTQPEASLHLRSNWDVIDVFCSAEMLFPVIFLSFLSILYL